MAASHNTVSQALGPRELSALNRIGDCMIARHGEFPAFSELGCVQHVDGVVGYAPPEDIAQLRGLLKALSFAPTFVLRLLVRLMQGKDRWPEPIATNLRLLDMGLRSIVVTLYYSGKKGDHYTGKTPLELIGYEVNTVRSPAADAE